MYIVDIMHTTKILFSSFVTHDVKRFILEKPRDYQFTPGQATEVAINKNGFKDKKHPFTFTSLNKDKVLEFIIKGYPVKKHPDHEGVTEQLHQLQPGEELLIDDPWGTINYKGSGVFVAGGAGITPFIAILRDLKNNDRLKGNRLYFSNKKREDVILEKEFKHMFDKDDLVLTLTREEHKDYQHGRIDRQFLEKNIDDFSQHFYVCGPGKMVQDLKAALASLGAQTESIVFEE